MQSTLAPTFTKALADRKILWAALAYGALIYFTLPPEAVAINDDFAYLKSVVQTLQHGRPWTNNWLEPWAASFSGICALVFAVTGRFHVATVGMQAVFAGVSFWALAQLFVSQGWSHRKSFGVTMLMLTFPTVLWKTLEFTGMALHLPCLFVALLAVQRKQWSLFGVAWLLAVANRQSAIAWAAFPAIAVLGTWICTRGFALRAIWRPAFVTIAGLAAWIVVARTMNKTVSQTVITDQVFQHASLKSAVSGLLTGLAVFLLGLGWANLVRPRNGAGPNCRSAMEIGVAAVLAAGVVLIDGRNYLSVEHPCFSGMDGLIYTKLIAAVAAAGWWRGGFKIRAELAFAALGGMGLIALRGEVWDYYLIDLAAFGFFAVKPCAEVAAAEKIGRSIDSWRWARRVAVVAVVAFHAFFFFQLKFKLDRGLAFCSVVERALRAGQLGPTDLSFPPFGFIAWHLHPYYAAHEGKGSDNIGGFDIYQRRDVAAVHSRYGGILRVLPMFRDEPFIEKDKLLVHEWRRIAWIFPVDYWLVRLPEEKIVPAAVRLNATEYRTVPFPLNDAEWTALIEGPNL